MKKLFYFTLLLVLMASCTRKDPSTNDIKSPCVAKKDFSNNITPCIKFTPRGNIFV